jgi:putative transposase
MIEPGHETLSLRRQAALPGINRNRLTVRTHPARAAWEEDQKALRELDRLHTRWPFYGQRKLLVEMRRAGVVINRKRLRRLMAEAGIAAVAPKRWTSQPQASHAKYPYLLRDLKVEAPDQVWCADITYIPMEKGHAYLVAVIDWHTRAVLSWKLSNTFDTSFCLAALREAGTVAGCAPGVFNTDQGCQFTSQEWIAAVESKGSRVSMDGRGRWMDNIFIERLWRSLKCERIYLSSFGDLHRAGGGHCPVDKRLQPPPHSPSPRLHHAVGKLPARPGACHNGLKDRKG